MRKTLSGWIVTMKSCPGQHHVFGGNSWLIDSQWALSKDPVLIMVIDMLDPRFSTANTKLEKLPIASFLNCDGWISEQEYIIHTEDRSLTFLSTPAEDVFVQDDIDALPVPLPEKRVFLRNMESSEIPHDDESYWEACDEFMGGDSFFRLFGPPLWLDRDNPLSASCSACSVQMQYICSIGYEPYDRPSGIVDDQTPFFFGEGVLYFFFCPRCNRVKVLSQT